MINFDSEKMNELFSIIFVIEIKSFKIEIFEEF